MVDVATLGFATDSSDLRKAEDDLHDVARASAAAEAAADSYGASSQQAYGRAARGAKGAEAATQQLTRATRQLAFAQRNLGFQLVDVVQGFALGQDALTIAAQQGFQIAQIFGPGSGGVTAILGGTARQLTRFAARLAPAGAALTAFGLIAEGFRRDLEETSGEAVSFGETLVAVAQVVGRQFAEALGTELQALQTTAESVFDAITSAARDGLSVLLDYGSRLWNVVLAARSLITEGRTLSEVAQEIATAIRTVNDPLADFGAEVQRQIDENQAAKLAEGWRAFVEVSSDVENSLARLGAQVAAQTRTPGERYTEDLERLREAQAAGEIDARQFGRAQARAAALTANAYAGLANNIGTSLGTIFGESKGVAIAQALINTAQAVTTNLAQFPGPLGFVAAAAAAAAGLAQVATIRSTQPNSGGAVSAPAISAPVAAAAPQVSRNINLTLVGDNFSRAQIEQLAEGFGEFIGDGGTIRTGTA